MNKSIFAALLMATTLICTSCRKDKDENAGPEAGIVGKWKVERMEYTDSGDLNGDGITDDPEIYIELGGAEDYVLFGADGKCTTFIDGDEDKATWRMEGNNNLQIKYEDEDDSISFAIKEWTNNQLVLYAAEESAGAKYEEIIYLYK
ncbi:Lipocalin-like domain-containing protein [Cnuella takakiae]|uniref:Lipocalin-like domain-containing protein n=1 Tax=Cnuella takakiae TaxID=1302690 RepID=A0A1M5HZV1_9BACT|nr:lipocalin family protein [Cnuella takakiae]OLY91398.1 hypothetical protein BUE76_05395 [Cnuella takakiae]SHG21339.1 Lipocalin-like domain-containing protein [Cnuella takakiae]